MNLFATILTYPAPSANYRGESELNRTVIQKVTDGRFDYPIFSPESIRNALREILKKYGLPCNRERLHPITGKGKTDDAEAEKQGLAVKFKAYPDPERFADDFFFGYLLAVKGKEMDKLRKEKGEAYPMKRDSVFRMNMAKALEPYRHNAVFTQSPEIKDSPWKPGGGDSRASSALLHRETAVSAFQYPFAINVDDCLYPTAREKKEGKPNPLTKEWMRQLLTAIGELNNVAGNHARSYFEMAPASIIARYSTSLVAGYQTYCFKPKGKTLADEIPDVVHDILAGDFPKEHAKEFYIGGEIVKRVLSEKQLANLKQNCGEDNVNRDPRRLLDVLAEKALGSKEV